MDGGGGGGGRWGGIGQANSRLERPVHSRHCCSMLLELLNTTSISLGRTHCRTVAHFIVKQVEEPAWKVRRAKQQKAQKEKEKELRNLKRKAEGKPPAPNPETENDDDDDGDPDVPHWGELLEDAKREGAEAVGADGKDGGGDGDGGARAGEGSDEAAKKEKREKKKKNKKKKGLSWNKKAANLWVYVKGELLSGRTEVSGVMLVTIGSDGVC